MTHPVTALIVLLSVGLAACSTTKPAEPPPNTPEQPATPTGQVGMVDATILFTDCASVSDYSATKAEKTMRRLVEGCDGVPGGQAEFVATLMPGGRIELSAVEGKEGTVPMCVLKHQLTHQVSVRKACKMHIQMEQRTSTH